MFDGLPLGPVPDRLESKYLVPNEVAAWLEASLATRLRICRPPWGLPITTVYFDTARRELLRRALRERSSVKVRVREYGDGPMAHSVWLEIKRRHGSRTGKGRIRIDRSRVVAGVERGQISMPDTGAEALAVRELDEVRAAVTGTLSPACAVAYRRTAWHDDDAGLRVTIDRRIEFLAPPRQPWSDTETLRSGLGRRLHGLGTKAILEVKAREQPPGWLTTLLGDLELQATELSKFVMGSWAVGAERAQAAMSA